MAWPWFLMGSALNVRGGSIMYLMTSLYWFTSGELIISGVGAIQGNRYFVEFFTDVLIQDLSVFGVAVVNGGGVSPGTPEYTFPAASVPANSFFFLSEQSPPFMSSFFGSSLTEYYYSNLDLKQGDDTVELYQSGVVWDVFGDYTDGTGTSWEYYKGWAKRTQLPNPPSTTFNSSDWEFSGVGALSDPNSNNGGSYPFRFEFEGYLQATTSQAETTQPPTTQFETTQPPTTPVETTQPPTTQVETTQPPTTQVETTQPPTTQAKTTQLPTTRSETQPPTTLSRPETTQAQTTEAETTQAQTTEAETTQTQTTEAETTQAQTTEAATTQAQTTETETTQAQTTEAEATQAQTTEATTTQAQTTQTETTQPTSLQTRQPTSTHPSEVDGSTVRQATVATFDVQTTRDIAMTTTKPSLRQLAASHYQDTAVVVNTTPTEAPYAHVVGGSMLVVVLVEVGVLLALDMDNIYSQTKRGIKNLRALFNLRLQDID